MFRSLRRRNLICFALLIAACASSVLVMPGIRHRHDGGEVAHSHAAGSHGHSHSHGHGHFHSHTHGHSHSYSEDRSESERSGEVDSAADESSSHIHISLFGFELTLPDFLSDQSAPLVQRDQDNCEDGNRMGDVIELPSPFSFAQLINVTLRWTAIQCSFLQIEGKETPFCRTAISSDLIRELAPSAPPLPPPEAT